MTARSRLTIAFVIFFFLASLVCTFFAWKISTDVMNTENERFFLDDKATIQSMIEQSMRKDVLLGANLQSFWKGNDNVTRKEWADYINNLNINENYPGISSLQYVEKVLGKNKKAFIESVRMDKSVMPGGYPNFTIYPEVEKDVYYVVKYIEPYLGREKALGFDVSSESRREKALNKAIDTGKSASTGIIIAVTTGTPGISIFQPVYNKGAVTDTVEERRKAFKGTVYINYRVEELFSSIFKKNNYDLFPNLYFDMSDESLADSKPIYVHQPAEPVKENPILKGKEKIMIDGQELTITIIANSKYGVTDAQKRLPGIILLSGIFFSFLTFIMLMIYLVRHGFFAKRGI